MGSGLILLVIVGAWLAVLVPMALRSSGGGTVSRTAERFGEAVRVLAPRSSSVSGGRSVSASSDGSDPEDRRRSLFEPLLHRVRRPAPRRPLSLVARRRRVLLGLLAAAAACLLGGLLSGWLLVAGVVLLGLAVGYVVHLRRLALAREEQLLRDAWDTWDAQERGDAARRVGWDAGWDTGAGAVPGLPDRLPDRVPPPEPAYAPVPAASRYADVPAALGAEWSPLPVPPPLYVGQPAAPRRQARTLDPSPAGASATVSAGELGTEPDLELDQILDGQRVVGGW